MRSLILPLVALTALVAVVPAIDLLAAPKNRPHDYKVSVTFQDGTNKIQSDGGGTYEDGVGGVVAYLGSSANGMLIFGTNTSNFPGRTLQYFFDLCVVAPCTPPGGVTPLNESGGLQANALRNGVVPPGGMTSMAVDETLEAWVKFNIPLDWDSAYWNVCFDGNGITPPCSATGAASVNAQIHRQTRSTWRIFATSPATADVIQDTSAHRTTRYFVKGTYSMPFDLTVACVNTDGDGNCL